MILSGAVERRSLSRRTCDASAVAVDGDLRRPEPGRQPGGEVGRCSPVLAQSAPGAGRRRAHPRDRGRRTLRASTRRATLLITTYAAAVVPSSAMKKWSWRVLAGAEPGEQTSRRDRVLNQIDIAVQMQPEPCRPYPSHRDNRRQIALFSRCAPSSSARRSEPVSRCPASGPSAARTRSLVEYRRPVRAASPAATIAAPVRRPRSTIKSTSAASDRRPGPPERRRRSQGRRCESPRRR